MSARVHVPFSFISNNTALFEAFNTAFSSLITMRRTSHHVIVIHSYDTPLLSY